MEGGVYVVLITAPRGKGREIARRLVEERLAACVNVAPVGSIYLWEGKIEEDEEDLLIVKTTADNISKLVERVKEIHPYQVPEVIALPVAACLQDYCSWVRREAKPAQLK
jgi:periplasmic divalent cation tolerance protein